MSLAHIEGFKYQTHKDWVTYVGDFGQKEDITDGWLTLSKEGRLTIRAGYAWDGASGLLTINTMNSRQGSVLHDALYQLMRRELISRKYKSKADQRFYDQLIMDGMAQFRAKYWRRAVNKFGHPATLPSHKRQVIYAP